VRLQNQLRSSTTKLKNDPVLVVGADAFSLTMVIGIVGSRELVRGRLASRFFCHRVCNHIGVALGVALGVACGVAYGIACGVAYIVGVSAAALGAL